MADDLVNAAPSVPRWSLQTPEEERDHNRAIRTLEAKLEQVQQRSHERAIIAALENDEMIPQGIDDDDDEGQPLLPSNCNEHSSKTERQYTQTGLWRWIPLDCIYAFGQSYCCSFCGMLNDHE